MQAVLGLSLTSASVGWVLLDGQGPDAATLDNDAFDVRSSGEPTACDTSQHAAAARGAHTIATTSGYKVGAVQVTWTPAAEADGTALLKSLAELGFDNVLAIPLSQATQAWGIEVGREHHTTALCVLEPDTATVIVVATGAGTVRTAVIDNRETTALLVESLRTIFRRDGWLPESLHLVGSRVDLDHIAEPIGDALPIPVFEAVDTQLALARGAALAMSEQAGLGSSLAAEAPQDRPWRVSVPKESVASTVAAPVVAPVVDEVDTGAKQAPDAPRRDSPPRRERPWVASHAKKLVISAAAVSVCGAALSLAAGSALNVETVSAEAAEQPAGGASVTSASVHPVPAQVSASPVAPVQPLAALPPPAPPAPPEPVALPAEPVFAAAPEPVAVPVPRQTTAVPRPTAHVVAPAAPPPVAPLAAPAPAPAAPPAAALVAPAPVPAAPPPVAPLAVPAPALGAPPGPIAPLAVPAPALGAPPGPIAPPPAAPATQEAPMAPPPAPQAPTDPAPPPDPIDIVLNPLFGGLP